MLSPVHFSNQFFYSLPTPSKFIPKLNGASKVTSRCRSPLKPRHSSRPPKIPSQRLLAASAAHATSARGARYVTETPKLPVRISSHRLCNTLSHPLISPTSPFGCTKIEREVGRICVKWRHRWYTSGKLHSGSLRFRNFGGSGSWGEGGSVGEGLDILSFCGYDFCKVKVRRKNCEILPWHL